MPSLLQRAVLELGINVPVYRADFDERRHVVLLFLYGGQVAEWTPPEFREEPVETAIATGAESSVATVKTQTGELEENPVTTAPAESEVSGTTMETETPAAELDSVATDDLTLIPSVGAKTADRLHDAGFHTFLDLAAADNHNLDNLVGTYTATKIRDYLYVNSIGETHERR